MAKINKPWLKIYGNTPELVDCPEITLYGMIKETTNKYKGSIALEFMGRRIPYVALLKQVDQVANGLYEKGLRYGDTVMVAMPNTPNAVIMFYALNKIGVKIAMVHPLSSPTEMVHYINETGAVWAITVDLFYDKFKTVMEKTKIKKLLLTSVSDYLPLVKSVAYKVANRKKIKIQPTDRIMFWDEILKSRCKIPQAIELKPKDGAVILFSGGTSNMPKGILLSSYAFNALAVQMEAITGFKNGDSILAILPIFHGFGLGLCIHTSLVVGAMSILIPTFSAKVYIKNLIKYKPSFIAGVPTLFEALLRDENFKKVRFDRLKGAFSGGDSLSYEIKQRFDEAIMSQGSKTELAEGYGVTECVTACVVSPKGRYKQRSMGVPIPNMSVKIVREGTTEEIGIGEEGEICVAGPTLMIEYVNSPQETADTLRTHKDGNVWLHTGDVGHMDQEGYIYFKSRLKRVIKVSGVNVYPTQIEGVLEAHEEVWRACVVGVPDDYQMSSVKAFIVLNDKSKVGDDMKKQLQEYCKEHLMKWSIPKHIEFIDEMPTTLVGKVAYKELEKR